MNPDQVFSEMRATAYQDPLMEAKHAEQVKFFRQIDRMRSLGITVNK